jgi:hypothetical protein
VYLWSRLEAKAMTITVSITGDSGDELGRIDIEKLSQTLNGHADYSVRYAVDRVHAIGLHGRVIGGFDPFKYNVLGLLRLALENLTEEELRHEDGVYPTDMARGQRRTLPALPSEETDQGGNY